VGDPPGGTTNESPIDEGNEREELGLVHLSLPHLVLSSASAWPLAYSRSSGVFTKIPPIPYWIAVAAFVLFLSVAEFAAFHQLRLHRDEGEQPGLTLQAQAPLWKVGGNAWNDNLRQIDLKNR